jgi:DNA polymerase-1
MFDSKKFRRALLKSGVTDFHIDDIATLAYQENNLNKNAEFEVVLEEKLRENFPLDNSSLSQFERLERLPDLKLTLMNELTERQIMYYQRIEIPVLDVVSEMENTGLKLNTAKLKAIHDKFEEMITQCDDFLSSAAGRRVNSRNRKDIEILLYDDLKFPQIKKRSTDADTITELGRKFPASKPIFNTIALAFRNVTMIEKYTSRYGDFVDEDSGHIHPTINTRSTKTGRLSCKDPNLMGIPKKSREGKLIKAAFEAPEKLIIVKADYSQIELKILAHSSQEPVLLHGFRNNLDVHRATASAVFGKSYEEVTDTERNSAKAINYGLIYGMQKYSLAKEINVTPNEAENFISTYFEKMPMVKKFLDWTVEKAHQNGYVKTILGRHINIDNINSNEQKLVRAAERQATNAPMQGSAADIVKKAMADLDIIRKERGLDFKCALQVHDELIIYSTEDGLMEAKKALKEAMENAVKLRVPINVDVEMGYNLISKTIDKKEPQNEYAA